MIPYKPEFPYKGNQVMISSGRVLLHAKQDAIFLFGKKGVGISTKNTFNVDALEGTIVNSNKIDLGLRAQYRVIKGEIMLGQLDRLLDAITTLGQIVQEIAKKSMNNVSELPQLSIQLTQVGEVAKDVKNQLRAHALSEVTRTN